MTYSPTATGPGQDGYWGDVYGSSSVQNQFPVGSWKSKDGKYTGNLGTSKFYPIVNKETGVKESRAMELGLKPILGSETEYNLPGSGSERTTVDLKLKVPHTVSFTNKKGKTKSARSGTKQADKLRKKFLKKKDKVQKGYKGQEKTETGKVITYKKGTVEYS